MSLDGILSATVIKESGVCMAETNTKIVKQVGESEGWSLSQIDCAMVNTSCGEYRAQLNSVCQYCLSNAVYGGCR